ncbi:MEKHLA domain-containing protein [Thiocapsa roseopersicina]|uniref:MEKHLA domain-containing protein n=1 Tax=Thiocapsa roseopersicina TaxID=1058 RepID=A0A1H2TWH4_THIRO|nr:MEKHLA domain-containing protein [Thiocapsa roseopersicina]SDW48222.1 MEKHLA domain-containing protein [Thiocapsa roseopersicina]
MPFPYPDPSNDFLSDHTRLLCASYRRLTGRDLIDPGLDDREAARRLFAAPFALLSHNADPDPILTYGNRRVLDLFELDWEQLTRMPSRLTAEAPDREERARLLAQVTAHGFIDHYSGVRVSSGGRRYRIDGAVVWNLIDRKGRHLGQAATFASVQPLV